MSDLDSIVSVCVPVQYQQEVELFISLLQLGEITSLGDLIKLEANFIAAIVHP